MKQTTEVTIFTIPKPFIGIFNIIQRNAIQSWHNMAEKPHVILFGDEEGIAEIAKEFNITHIKNIKKNEFGSPLLDDVFEKAELAATSELMAYVNCDIILLDDFTTVTSHINSTVKENFLISGERIDLDKKNLIDFSDNNWKKHVRHEALMYGAPHGPGGADYFVYKKGTFPDVPPFAVGRPYYDNWFFWATIAKGFKVFNSTKSVLSIHQNHERTYSSIGREKVKGVDDFRSSIECDSNFKLAGESNNKIWNILYAPYSIDADLTIKKNYNVPSLIGRMQGTSLGSVALSALYFFQEIILYFASISFATLIVSLSLLYLALKSADNNVFMLYLALQFVILLQVHTYLKIQKQIGEEGWKIRSHIRNLRNY